jgi:hypothetical protein
MPIGPAVGRRADGHGPVRGSAPAGDAGAVRFQTLVVWRRLRPLLSDGVRSQVNDARKQLDASVRFCVVGVLAAVICTPLLFRYDSWLLLAFGCYLSVGRATGRR